MQEERVSALTVCEREFIIEAGGKDRTEAFAQAFSALKARAYKEVDGLIVEMQPQDVFVLSEEERSKTEQLADYFKPRELKPYNIKVSIIVRLKYIPNK